MADIESIDWISAATTTEPNPTTSERVPLLLLISGAAAMPARSNALSP